MEERGRIRSWRMICPTRRRTCRGRPVVCLGPCNRANRHRENKVEDDKSPEAFPNFSSRRQDSLNPMGNQVELPAEKFCRVKTLEQGNRYSPGCAMTSDQTGAAKTISETLTTFVGSTPAAPTSVFQSILNFPLILSNRVGRFLLTESSPLTNCLIAGAIFVGGHVLVAYLAWSTPVETFFAAELCGLITFLCWSLCDTIPLWQLLIKQRKRQVQDKAGKDRLKFTDNRLVKWACQEAGKFEDTARKRSGKGVKREREWGVWKRVERITESQWILRREGTQTSYPNNLD